MPSYPGAIVPATPFPHPVPLPTLGTGMVTITLDQGWLPYLVGAAKALTAASTWDPPVLADIATTILAAYDLLQVLSGAQSGTCADQIPIYGSWELNDMPLVRQNPANLCQFQIQCPDGTWDTVYDGSLCVTNPAPGAGASPPGPGGCKNYTLFPKANALTPLPFLVNTGDQIIISSEMGAGSDGTLDWFCPDGSFFVAGACAGGGAPAGTDPLPSHNHMSLIFRIGSSYYPAGVGTFTVPGGVTNQAIYIQVNDSSLTDDTGEYTVALQYCNNTTPPTLTWCRLLDFTISPDGATPQSFNHGGACGTPTMVWGQWISGTGLEGTPFTQLDCTHGLSSGRWLIDLGVTATVTASELKGSLNQANPNNDAYVQISNDPTFATGVTTLNNPNVTAGGSYDDAASVTGVGRYLRLHTDALGGTGSGSATAIISSLKLKGTGVNPFGADNC